MYISDLGPGRRTVFLWCEVFPRTSESEALSAGVANSPRHLLPPDAPRSRGKGKQRMRVRKARDGVISLCNQVFPSIHVKTGKLHSIVNGTC